MFQTGLVLSDQKTIAAKGTFLENGELVKQWYQEGYSIIEMETGPYMNAMYEFVYYNRYVENEFINLTGAPFEIGIDHHRPKLVKLKAPAVNPDPNLTEKRIALALNHDGDAGRQNQERPG